MSQLSPGSLSRHERLFLFILVSLALLIRLYRIGSQSLWIDEMMTLSVSSPKDGLNIWSYIKYNIHGSLHSFVVYLFQLISLNDGWLRLPGALAGAGAVAYFYMWVRLWIGRNTARVGAVLLAFHPLHIHYSQELRNYSFLLFFCLVACYYFERMQRSGRRRSWILYTISVVCAALSNFTAAFMFVTQTILYFTRNRIGRETIMRWCAVSLVLLVLLSPWIYRVYTFIDVSDLVTPVVPGQIAETERLRGETTVTLAAIPYTAYTFSVGFSLGPSTRELHENTSLRYLLGNHVISLLWVSLLLGGLFVWGICVSIKRRGPWKEMLLYLCLPIVLTLFLNWQNAKAFNVRYVLPAFPVFLCFLATGLAGMKGRTGKIVLTLVVATLLWSDMNYFHNGRFAREDIRGTVRYVEEHISDGECLFAPTVGKIVQHYYSGIESVHSVYNPIGQNREQLETRLAGIFAECNRVWYIRSRPWVDDPGGTVLETFRQYYRQSDVIYFDGVEVFYFEEKNEVD